MYVCMCVHPGSHDPNLDNKLKPTSHRRRDETIEFRLVDVGGVNWTAYRQQSARRMLRGLKGNFAISIGHSRLIQDCVKSLNTCEW